MKAADIMTTQVVTANDESRIADVANLLLQNHISAVPVVDGSGKLVGIVSEGDLVRRAEIGTQSRHSWWLEMFSSPEALAREYIKEHGQRARDIMTKNVVTVGPDASLDVIANLLESHRIKRVPVVENDKLVGIVSRSNLVRALAAGAKDLLATGNPDDANIRERVISGLKSEPWCPFMLNVVVHKGQVDLWGIVKNEDEKRAARIAAEVTPGVVAVQDKLVISPPSYV